MPAPRRAILSDISELELSTKDRLTVDKNGRLANSRKNSTIEENVSIPASQVEPQVQMPQVVELEETSFVTEKISDPDIESQEESLSAESANLSVEPPSAVEVEKPKARTGRFKKKESTSSA